MSAALSASAQSAAKPVDKAVLVLRIVLGVALLAAWEIAGRKFGHNWTSLPSLIFQRLVELGKTTLWTHVGVTLAEIAIGLVIGATAGIALGLILGRTASPAWCCGR
jgi:NitT/TauT family transport system permease protein